MSRGVRTAVWILFVLYVLTMLLLLFYPDRNGYDAQTGYWELFRSNYNLVPFATIRLYTYVLANNVTAYRHAAIVNLFGNIFTFIPLGIFLPLLFEKCRKPMLTLIVSACFICLIEITQLFTLTGCCDIDDLILNMIGVAVGLVLYRITNLAKG